MGELLGGFLFEGSSWYLMHVPFLLYFLVSLQDIPLDLAILRFITCCLFPVSLWWAFAQSPLLGIGVCAALWVFFTRPTPFSVIRLPYGGLRMRVRQAMGHEKIRKILRTKDGVFVEDEAVNPFAAFAFVEIITPLITGINKLEYVFGPKKKKDRVIPTSEINWLFSKINEVGWLVDNAAKTNIFWSNTKHLQKLVRKLHAPEFVDFDDPALDGLRMFYRDMEYQKNSRRVTAVGRLLLNNFVLGTLVARESVVRYMKNNPFIVEENKIEKPIFIIGLPRTGSTFLQGLLAQDPDARHIRMWETNIPTPPPREDTYKVDPRCEMVEKGLHSAKIIDEHYLEGMRQYHYVCGEAAEEDLMLFHHNLFYFSQYFLCGEGEYKQFFYSKTNKAYIYRYLRRYLQVISAHYRARSHFVLKAPVHTLFVDSLLREFPDSRVIVTHRDPVPIVMSWAQFQAQMLNIYTDLSHDNSIPYVKETFFMLQEMCKRLIEFRKTHPNPSQFLDVRFNELTNDPIGTVKKIYDYFGLTFTERFHENLKKFIVANPKEGKSSAKKVPLEDAGLSQEQVREAFSDYINEYLK